MRTGKTSLSGTIIVLVIILGLIPGFLAAQQTGIKRTELQRHNLSLPGHEVVQVRVDFPAGTAFGMHRHPGEEIINVLEGTFEYEIEGQPPVTLKAGDVLFIPAGKNHSAKNVGKDIASELATYVVEKGKPLVVLKENKPEVKNK